jgi:hypothetical protein
MGQKSARTKAFKAQHPYCCFCGGEKATETIDHQPGRALFNQRQWPEGYEFPACIECNSESRNEEQIWALLVRISLNDETANDPEFLKYAKAIGNNFPDLLRKFTTNEVRRFFKENDLTREPGQSYSDIVIAEVNPKHGRRAFDTVLKKLMKALHYKHTGNIASLSAEIRFHWHTNSSFHRLANAQGLPALIKALDITPTLARSGRDLSSQFSYRAHVEADGKTSAFMLIFRDSIVAIGLVEDR